MITDRFSSLICYLSSVIYSEEKILIIKFGTLPKNDIRLLFNKLGFEKIFVTGSPGGASLIVTLIKSIRKLNGLSRNLAK